MRSQERTGSVLAQEVRYVKGVGPKRAQLLAKLGLHTVEDLIFHLPRQYEDRRKATRIAQLKVGDRAVVSGEITSVQYRIPHRSRRRGILEVCVSDGSGMLGLIWFNARPGWQSTFPKGERITAYGQVDMYDGPQMVAPDYELGKPPEESAKFGRIVPVYPLTEGLTQSIMRKLAETALEAGASLVPDVVPAGLSSARKLGSIYEALRQAHFPQSVETAQAARRRLGYGELLAFQAAFALHRAHVRTAPGIAFKVGPNVDRRIRRLFPFELTRAQNRVIEEVAGDMRSERPMNRLLQGDVGSGKTIVAVYAMLAALAESSKRYQAALMAPTEVLAEQHFLTLESLLERARVRTLLLSGAAAAGERALNLRRVAAGEVDVVVGTHALIEEDVEFSNLALLVIDEQHRFGVRQRLALREKAARRPDVLIMTATPIPRTLALACFGDMDVSIIDEMPPGRQPIETRLLPSAQWELAFQAALAELRRGRRVFVIYPLVEESEALDITSATEGYRELNAGVFRDFECCLLHGQMRHESKREAMEGFRTGRYQVMIATTVVEVGIDVPEATVMIVQHAERLGLAQLHQLRGRIGRGGDRGMCFPLAEPTTEEARRRLEVLAGTTDGFKIAEADLSIRGPGEVFGTQQSGAPEFRCYDFSDTSLLDEARKDAFALIESDPTLSRPEHTLLRDTVRRQYGKRFMLGGVG